MVHVVAVLDLEDGAREQFLPHFRWLVPLVRDEEGCIEYDGTTDLPTSIVGQAPCRADRVTVIEKWRNVEALEAHGQAPHMREYRRRVKGLLKSVVIHVLEPAS